MKILILFTILSIINVIFSTIRSLVTISGGKVVASFVNAGYFAFYTVMLIYTVADFPLWQKCLVCFICNLIGVYIVKYLEEKMRKEKLWKIETAVRIKDAEAVSTMLSKANIPYNCVDTTNHYTIFNVFCATSRQSIAVREILKQFHAKYFVSESKDL